MLSGNKIKHFTNVPTTNLSVLPRLVNKNETYIKYLFLVCRSHGEKVFEQLSLMRSTLIGF